jgi:hypothetical protein
VPSVWYLRIFIVIFEASAHLNLRYNVDILKKKDEWI